MYTLWVFLKKEVKQTLRDPQLLKTILITPLIYLLLFGYIASTDVKNISTIFVDYDKSVASRTLIGRFTNSGYFSAGLFGDSEADVVRALDANRARVAVVIPPGYGRMLASGDAAQVQVVVDGTDSNTGAVAQSYAAEIIGSQSTALTQGRFAQYKTLGIRVPSVEARSRVWYNPTLASVNYMVPSLIGVILAMTTIPLSSKVIVRERAAGTLEQLMVTPIKRWQLLLGKMLPFVVLGFIIVTFVTVLGIVWFQVPMAGSYTLLISLSGLALFALLGQGILISTISQTMQQASINSQLVLMPSLLLSGFFFPVSGMPIWMQYVTYLIPLRYLLDITRGIVLRGATLADLWPDVVGLAVLGLVTFTIAVFGFSKRLEG